MKEGFAIIFLIVLLALGWKQSYQSQLQQLFDISSSRPATPRREAPAVSPATPARAVAVPAATPDRAWLFGPRKMDQPYPSQNSR